MSNPIASAARPARPAPTHTEWATRAELAEPIAYRAPVGPTRADRIALAVGRLVILSAGTLAFSVAAALVANFLYTL